MGAYGNPINRRANLQSNPMMPSRRNTGMNFLASPASVTPAATPSPSPDQSTSPGLPSPVGGEGGAYAGPTTTPNYTQFSNNPLAQLQSNMGISNWGNTPAMGSSDYNTQMANAMRSQASREGANAYGPNSIFNQLGKQWMGNNWNMYDYLDRANAPATVQQSTSPTGQALSNDDFLVNNYIANNVNLPPGHPLAAAVAARKQQMQAAQAPTPSPATAGGDQSLEEVAAIEKGKLPNSPNVIDYLIPGGKGQTGGGDPGPGIGEFFKPQMGLKNRGAETVNPLMSLLSQLQGANQGYWMGNYGRQAMGGFGQSQSNPLMALMSLFGGGNQMGMGNPFASGGMGFLGSPSSYMGGNNQSLQQMFPEGYSFDSMNGMPISNNYNPMNSPYRGIF